MNKKKRTHYNETLEEIDHNQEKWNNPNAKRQEMPLKDGEIWRN